MLPVLLPNAGFLPHVSFASIRRLTWIVVAVAPTLCPAAISFVQSNYAVPQTPQSTVSVSYSAAQGAGDTNIVAIGWTDSTSSVTSVTDSKGNVYSPALPATVQSGVQSQIIYIANNICLLYTSDAADE